MRRSIYGHLFNSLGTQSQAHLFSEESGDLFSDSQGVVAEVFTKPLARVKFYRLIGIILGLVRDDEAPTVAGLSPVSPFFLGPRQAPAGSRRVGKRPGEDGLRQSTVHTRVMAERPPANCE